MSSSARGAFEKELLPLFITIFMFSLGVGIATPIIPLLAQSLGASYTEVGFVGTSYSIIFIMFAALSRKLSDRLGRRALILVSAVLNAAATVLYLIAGNVNETILIRTLEGLAWAAFWPSVEALTTDIANASESGRAMGLSSASYGIGFALGSLLGGSIAATTGYRNTFYFSCGIGMMMAAAAQRNNRRPVQPSLPLYSMCADFHSFCCRIGCSPTTCRSLLKEIDSLQRTTVRHSDRGHMYQSSACARKYVSASCRTES